jgi:F-type H+-transporting ATPase subunit b
MICHRKLSASFRRATAAAVVLAAAAPASAAAPNPGTIGQGIAAVVIFLILLAVLGKYAWGPIVTQLRRREEEIEATRKRTESRSQEAEDLKTHYQARLERADSEARELLDTARREAEQHREQVLADARTQARQILLNAQEEIEAARHRAQRELYDAGADLASDLASQVLGHSLDKREHRRLIDESLEQIRQRVEEGRS